jgi:hypothetical protein
LRDQAFPQQEAFLGAGPEAAIDKGGLQSINQRRPLTSIADADVCHGLEGCQAMRGG